MCCPPKLPFFIKNVPLNFTICCIYLHEVLYPTIFLPYERTSVFYYNMLTRGAYPSGISSSRLDMKLNFIPVIPSVSGVNWFTWQIYKLQTRSQFLLTSATINNNVIT